MNITALLDTLEFSQPMSTSTKRGPRLLRKASVTSEFWALYREDKDDYKQAMGDLGFQLSKFREEWELAWWSRADLSFPTIPSSSPEKVEPEVKYDLPPLLYPEKLFEYQLTSVQLALRSMSKYNRALLGHGTGMGKTAIALAVARERGRRVAVICPKPITTDWHRLAKYLGVETYEVCGWEWVKTGKSKIGRWTDDKKKEFQFMLPPDTDLIFDEVHRAKAQGNTQNAFLLRDAVVQNIPTIALSATIADDPTKMWALGQFLGLHQGGRDFFRFLNANGCYNTQFGMQFKGNNKVLKNLHGRIFPDRGNRLKPSDVGSAFPETLIQARAFDMDTAREIAKEYDDLLMRVEQIKMQENVASSMGAVLAEMTRARQKIELFKAPAVCAMVKDLIEEGNSVFIAVNFTETLKFMEEELKTTCSIRGGQSDIVRRGNIDSFQNDKSRVIIGIIQACREGLNLHDLNGKYSRVALIMPTYSVFDLKQVLGRVHRAGGKSKSIQYLIYAAGVDIEESVCSSLDAKLKRMDTLMDGEVDGTISVAPKEVNA
jgi:superfamily II DNA or RNA helicase